MVGPNAVKVYSFVQSFSVCESSLVTTLTVSLRSEGVRLKFAKRAVTQLTNYFSHLPSLVFQIIFLLLCCYHCCPLISLRHPLISLLRGVSFACTQACRKTIFVTSQTMKNYLMQGSESFVHSRI
jgi:hypothetical protein